jgi:hypothetical protein
MAIISTELEFRESGADNLGGTIQAGVVSGSINAMFDRITSAEAGAGDVEYRCIYLRNSNATLTLYDAHVWISANTTSDGTSAEIGLGASGINGAESEIADEETAPAGVTFYSAANEGAALLIGDIPPNQHIALWIKRTVNVGAVATASDSMSIVFKGDTEAGHSGE